MGVILADVIRTRLARLTIHRRTRHLTVRGRNRDRIRMTTRTRDRVRRGDCSSLSAVEDFYTYHPISSGVLSLRRPARCCPQHTYILDSGDTRYYTPNTSSSPTVSGDDTRWYCISNPMTLEIIYIMIDIIQRRFRCPILVLFLILGDVSIVCLRLFSVALNRLSVGIGRALLGDNLQRRQIARPNY